MKKNIINLAGALLSSAILMFGCSEDLPSYSDLKLDKTEVFIQADGENPTATVNIIEGNGNYSVTVADENVATATLNGDQITLNGVANGSTTVTIMDWSKHSAVIKVNVKEDFELTLDKAELVMTKATNPTELVGIVSGNGGYQVESNNSEVAIGELTSDGKVKVIAVDNGSATITVTDADGRKASINVTVCDQLVLEEVASKIIINETLNIAITLGNGEYNVISDNPAIATAAVSEAGDAITITGVSKGKANITVTDKLGFTATITIQVVSDFKLEKTAIGLLNISTPQTITILEGSGDYTITSSESLKCTISEDKNTLTISGIEKKMALNQKVTVKDNKLDLSLDITIKEVNYEFDAYETARWFIDGAFGIPNNSKFEIKGGREYLSVGTKSGSKYTNGYILSFEGNRLIVGNKQNPTLYRLNSAGEEVDPINVTYLEVYKTEDTGSDGSGKYWIRFYEGNNFEWSYIVTQTN